MDTTDAEILRRYLAATAAMGPHWRSDGEALAFIWNEPGSYHVYVATLTERDAEAGSSTVSRRGGGARAITRVTAGDDRCTDPRFLPSGELLYTSDSGGNENFQLYTARRADTAGAPWESRRLTSDDGAKHRAMSLGEHELLFTANDRDRARFTLYSQPLPLADWNPKPLHTPEKGMIRAAERLPSGGVLVELALGNMDQELLIVGDTPASLTGELSAGREVRWHFIRAAGDDSLLVATDLDSDRLRPVLLSLDGTITTIDAVEAMPASEFSDAAHREGDPATYLEFNDEGYSRLYRLSDLNTAASLAPVGLPLDGALVSGDARTSRFGLSLSQTGHRIAVAVSGPSDVSNVWVGELGDASGAGNGRIAVEWSRLTAASVPGVAREKLAGCTLSRFESFDGESIPYFTYLPESGSSASERPLPAVLFIHGGPEAQSRPIFNNVVQFLIAAGFAVIVPNIRGSAGYGRRYLDLDNRERRLDSIRDIAELARHLATTDDAIDGDRLAVMGASYGGFAVLSSLTEYPELWKAGVDIVGISNFVTFLQNTAPWRRSLRESEYGSLRHRELLQRISPINRIDRVVAPLLIIQGDNDERVPLSESIQMFERLQGLGRTAELMRFADEGHGVTKLDNRVAAYTRVGEWLREHL